MNEARPELEIDLSAISVERAEDLAERLKNYLPHMFEVVKMDEQDADYLRELVFNQYSEARWIPLIDPIGDHLPEDTFEAGYRIACYVLRVVLGEYIYGEGVMKQREKVED